MKGGKELCDCQSRGYILVVNENGKHDVWAAKGLQEPSPCRHLRLSWVPLLPTHQMTCPCARLQKGSPFRLYHCSGHITPYGPSNTPSVSLRHPSSPLARMIFTPHSPHLSLFSTQGHPPQDDVQAAQRGVRDSAPSVPPSPTPVSSPPGPTRTLAHHRLDPALQLHRTHHRPQQGPPRGLGLCHPSAWVPSSSILIPIPACSKPIPKAPFK